MTQTAATPGRAAGVVARARRGRLLADTPGRRTAGRRAGDDALDGGDRQLVIDLLLDALTSVYAHLPAKRAAYAVDPRQALLLLRRRAGDLSAVEFHRAVSGIVTGLRDAHTRYLGPTVLHGQVAVLPFLAEQYGPDQAPRYLVSKLNPDAVDDADYLTPSGEPPDPQDRLQAGSELLGWNGVPFARAVEIHADAETGGRPDSRRARAVESMTLRALGYTTAPDEDWVILGYRNGRRPVQEIRLRWRVLAPGRAATAGGRTARTASKQAADPAAEAVRRAKKQMFSTDLWLADQHPTARATPTGRSAATRPDAWLDTPLQDVLAAKPLRGGIGYLRIWSFDVDDDDAFVTELTRLLHLLPARGVIVDLRGNPGGLIWAAERSLQLFTDRPISPTRFSLAATPLTRRMADSPFNRLELEPWNTSLQDAVSTGELYAQPLPLTDPAWCNDQDWRYPGPAVAVVDANTYSSGDLFAAGWVDHDIGPLVSIGQATGAGGANVWTSEQLRDATLGTDQPWPAMPAGTGFTLAFRRAIRSAAGDGIPIEDLGVPGQPYEMTRADLLRSNVDLLAHCSRLLRDLEQPTPPEEAR